MLNKISASDVELIMDKYRVLADESGFIQSKERGGLEEDTLDESGVFEFEGIDAEGNHQNIFMRAFSTRIIADLGEDSEDEN